MNKYILILVILLISYIPLSAQFPQIFGVSSGGTGTGTAFTAGSVVFAGTSGVYTQDNPAFQYDSTNHCIAIGSGNTGCGATAGAARFFRNTNGVISVFQNTNAGQQLQFNVNNGTGAVILQNRNTADSANLPLELNTSGGNVNIQNAMVLSSGKVTQYGAVNTVGWGHPAIYAAGRVLAQTAAVASVATYTVGAADGTFLVSSNVNVTAATTASFTVTVTYTDETNTSRTLTLSFSNLTGTLLTTITNATGTGPYEGIPMHIRVKASTAITFATVGTFTSVTYNAEGYIQQIG